MQREALRHEELERALAGAREEVEVGRVQREALRVKERKRVQQGVLEQEEGGEGGDERVQRDALRG